MIEAAYPTCLGTWLSSGSRHRHVCCYPSDRHEGPCICSCGAAGASWRSECPVGPDDASAVDRRRLWPVAPGTPGANPRALGCSPRQLAGRANASRF